VIDDVIIENKHWNEKESGTAISITLEATYKGGKHGVASYLHQSALSNSHAFFVFTDPKGKVHNYPRVVDELPKEPKEIKPHPHGVELGTLMHLLEAGRGKTVSAFLKDTFSRVSAKTASDICKAAKVKGGASATKAGRMEAEALYNAIQTTKLLAPSTDCVSPIGEEALIKGLYWLFVEAQKHQEEERKEKKAQQDLFDAVDKEAEPSDAPVVEKEGGNVQMELALAPDGTLASDEQGYFVTAVTRSPNVYRGNPFQVEVGLFYGKGIAADDQARVFRFANRVPLQYQASACAMTKSVTSTRWKNYGLNQSRGALPIGPVVIMVHIASAWVPFTSESKEAIANYDEILKELRLAINECGRRLQKFLRRKRKEADEEKKRSYITKYMNPIGEALQEILGFSDDEREKTIGSLKVILEDTRGHMPGGHSDK
jgi:DNA topoisomerase-6 subunit B